MTRYCAKALHFMVNNKNVLERLQRAKRSKTLPVHCLARPRCPGASHTSTELHEESEIFLQTG